MKKLLYLIFPLILLSCNNDALEFEKNAVVIIEGDWILEFKPSLENTIPINLEIVKEDSTFKMIFFNGEEAIPYNSITIENNSFKVYDPIFSCWFEGEVINPTKFKGVWHKENNDYKIPFTAIKSSKERFPKPEILTDFNANMTGKWQVDFSIDNPNDHYPAIGLFQQDGNHLTGTFITETGDYRYLEGNMYNENFYLSSYDGAHLFLFKGTLVNDTLSGKFYSGNHWEEPFVAFRNNSFELSNPDSLTYLKEGYDKFAFSFPDLEGKNISLSDEKYQNKVVIVNIMGPWCPNCKDETVYLSSLYESHKSEGLEIIALSFNTTEDYETSKKTLSKMKKYLNADYDFLIAGKADKIAAAKALPRLNHVMSFPTTIFIDRKGNIRKIRTGFYGPGTGQYYTRYTEMTNDLVAKLLQEE